MMEIASVVGARPNFVKLAPVSKALRREFDEIIIHTGQHYDYEMNKIFFDELAIPEPDYHLDVGSGLQGHQTGEMIKRIEEVLTKEEPDFVLVFGDTNSTLAGALAAVKMNIRIGHVEAGLRSYNKAMPEEINRVLTDYCSKMLFCPTKTAAENLKREGITSGVHLTGDVMVDALEDAIKIAEKRSKIIDELGLRSKGYYLATLHRAENTNDHGRMKRIVDGLCEVRDLVFPCHPRTEKYLKLYDLWEKLNDKVLVTKPVGYLDMLILEKNAKKILTDSGGVQKEAYILKVPCITLRDETEWVETMEDGWNTLVGTDHARIVDAVRIIEPEGDQRPVFGDVGASDRIAKLIRANA